MSMSHDFTQDPKHPVPYDPKTHLNTMGPTKEEAEHIQAKHKEELAYKQKLGVTISAPKPGEGDPKHDLYPDPLNEATRDEQYKAKIEAGGTARLNAMRSDDEDGVQDRKGKRKLSGGFVDEVHLPPKKGAKHTESNDSPVLHVAKKNPLDYVDGREEHDKYSNMHSKTNNTQNSEFSEDNATHPENLSTHQAYYMAQVSADGTYKAPISGDHILNSQGGALHDPTSATKKM